MEQLKNYVVPLAHDNLTKDEVATRCIAAAEKKGYVPGDNPYFSYEKAKKWIGNPVSHFYANRSAGYEFHNHDCQEENRDDLTILEAFEEYCGVTVEAKRPKYIHQRVAALEQGLTDLEQRLDNLEQGFTNTEQKLDQLADILAEKLQEPNEEVKISSQPIYHAVFWFDGERQFLQLPDKTELYLSLIGAWKKDEGSDGREPYTFVEVEKHTVGKFYLLKDGEPNDFDNYALCLSTVNFVAAQKIAGVVTISAINRDHITLQEVQPLNK